MRNLSSISLAILCCVAAPLLRAQSPDSTASVQLSARSWEPGLEGLRFAFSPDGDHWTNVPGLFLKACVGGGTMRDPSLCRGPDGVWHLIWSTASQGEKGLGYSQSKDLVHWNTQRHLPVMEHEPGPASICAPGLSYDGESRRFVLRWAVPIPDRDSERRGFSTNNLRMFCATTTDFTTFSNVTDLAMLSMGMTQAATVVASRKELDYLFKVGTQQVANVRLPWSSPVPRETIRRRLAGIDSVAGRGPFKPDWAAITNRFKTPAWYQDAKFGVFIHWGVYSVPAFGSEWYPREMYVAGTKEFKHHVETYGPQARFGYKDFIPLFKAERFDADAWAALFKEAGVRYVIPVAEHHDGFPMYASDYTGWSAAKMGPGRDLIAAQAEACRKAGIVFGASSHRAEHWFFFDNGLYSDSDVRDTNNAALYGPAVNKRMAEAQAEPPDQAFMDDWLLRSCEIVDKYRPAVMYFDWWICQPVFQPYLKTFAAYYYNRGVEWNQQVAINFKEWEGCSFPRGSGVFDMERGQATRIEPEFWQTCTSVSRNSWGYVTNHNYKQTGELVDDLVDIVSKNGAMLLNIGPMADGAIPATEQRMLREIGAWLKVNGEAVYGTRPWRHSGEGPTQLAGGSFSDKTKKPEFTPEDIRFTTKPGVLYAIALAWPDNGVLLVRSLSNAAGPVRQVWLLGHSGPLDWRQTPEGLRVNLPPTPPSDHAFALAVTGDSLVP